MNILFLLSFQVYFVLTSNSKQQNNNLKNSNNFNFKFKKVSFNNPINKQYYENVNK